MHWPRVAAIYAAGIAGGNATFETEVPTWGQWCESHVDVPCLVVESTANGVLGWAALSRSSQRPVYRGVAEVSIYVDPAFTGQGIGTRLLDALIEISESAGFWTLTAGIFPENLASIALHEHAGFRLLGNRKAIGRAADGRWRDVLFYERRSSSVGLS